MSDNPKKIYNDTVRANLPSGMVFNTDVSRYQLNDHSFFNYTNANWYHQYITKFGYSSFSPAVLFALSEPGVWYDPSDLTTLFQDSAGTTPVTAPGQPVGLMLDKSQGLVLGPELVTNGGFDDGVTGWSAFSGATSISNVSGVLRVTIVSGAATASQTSPMATVIGETYSFTTQMLGTNGTGYKFYIGDSFGGGGPYTQILTTSTGTFNVMFVATSTTTYISLQVEGSPGDYGDFDNISVKELPGFHATQATASKRPTYGIEPFGGRRNLLTHSEQFDNAIWGKNSSSITANSSTAPDGTTTADLVVGAGAGGTFIRQDISVVAGAVSLSYYFKSGTATTATIGDVNIGVLANFNLATGTSTTVSATSSSIADAGGGWWRCSVVYTPVGTIAAQVFNPGITLSPVTSETLLVWGAQLEQGSTATPYQKVVTQFEVTEAGVPSVGYLSFDGIDDYMSTGDFAAPIAQPTSYYIGREWITLAAAPRHIFDGNAADRQFIVGDTTAEYLFAANSAPVIAAPTIGVPNVISARASGATSFLRKDGVQTAGDAGLNSMGGLYLGSNYLPGGHGNFKLYQFIIVGASASADQLASTEAYVAGKTGVTL